MNTENFKIYALKDPITNEIRYIGQTRKELNDRLYRHWRDRVQNKNKNNYTANWVNKLWLSYNCKPTIILIEENISNQILLNIREKYWITYYKSIGVRLTNTSDKDYFLITGIKRNSFKKQVYVYDRDFKEIIYESAREAEKYTNISYKIISGICLGKSATGLYCFSFLPLTKNEIINKFTPKNSIGVGVIGRNIKTGEEKEWISQQNAAKELGVNFRNINLCLKNKRKSCGEYEWRYNYKNQKTLS